ncbi:nucleophosmin isoform X1 [Notechis scutatus]|uniref:Nucleophosmin n=1 Tax=Notechis scutatus TaxID=8663 RepID=A0A6J1U067_9SAUR|nr:nucleophosmin isoform X1 [Notechis scutatus]
MEDSDMDNMGSLRPQTFLFGCELKGDKPYHFKVNDEENEHQLSLRTVSLGVGAKDELHVVEAEALDYEGNQIKVTLASLKMSVQPTVSLGGFEITPPVILRLKSGSGPVYVSGQHLVALEEEPESESEDEDKVQQNMVKRPAGVTLAKVPLKKAKMADKDFEDDDDDDDDDDEDDDDEDEDEEEEDKTPQKKPARDSSVKKTPKSKQNGKDSKLATPKLTTSKLKTQETPKGKAAETPKSPRPAKSPKQFSIEEIKAKMQSIMEKGMNLPKLEAKFANYIKSCYKAEDPKVIQELWQWRQSL